MEIALGVIDDSTDTYDQKLVNYLNCVRHYLALLEQSISDLGFQDDEQEIYFHKYIYPRFNACYFYHAELTPILKALPIGTDVMIRDYYIQELGYLHRGFNLNRYLYEYFLADDDVKDEPFFLHRNYSAAAHAMLPAFANPAFLTNQSLSFARFIAHERMQQFIIRRLRLLYQNPNDVFLAGLLKGKRRSWDGDKVELIEIAYGIYYTRRMNGGDADVSDIIEWLEDSLQIDLSQAYRIFLDIRRRKTVSFTKYLDEMRDAIVKHIEESNRFKDNRKRIKKNEAF
ncbi:RteC domain-containing protein [Mucilaginibacter pineti]|nr:RteC domain-containing protein [Mucilaginibacter pineti]